MEVLIIPVKEDSDEPLHVFPNFDHLVRYFVRGHRYFGCVLGFLHSWWQRLLPLEEKSVC